MTVPLLPKRWDWQAWGWALTGGFCALSLVVACVAPWPESCDFNAYHTAATRVGAGENPYRLDESGIHGTYRYPPAVAYLMVPLGWLPVAWAGRLWFAGLWVTLAGCAWLAVSLVFGRRPWPPGTGAVAFLALTACSCYSAHNLFQGQVALTMTLCCLGWVACRRAGRPFTGGLLLAVGCVLKLAPVVLVPYLLLRKDWRGLAGVAVGGLVLALTPAPWVGFDGAIRLHKEWLRHAKDTQVPEQNYRPGNQGLLGVTARLPPFSNGTTCYSHENLAALAEAYPFAVVALAAVLYGWVFLDLSKRRKRPFAATDWPRENLYLTLLFVFMTIAHPCAWRCNYEPLLLPCVILARHAYLRRPGGGWSRAALILTGLAWVWPAVVILLNVASVPDPAANATFMDIAKGEVASPNWSAVLWFAQGLHVWAAVFVGGVCWWLSNRGLDVNPPRTEAASETADERPREAAAALVDSAG